MRTAGHFLYKKDLTDHYLHVAILKYDFLVYNI
jgi:hypothetical protein